MFNAKIVKGITEGFELVQKGKAYWLEALEALEKAGCERSGLFSAEAMATVKGWPAKGLSLAQCRKEGKHNQNAIYKAMNSFSFYVYSETIADDDGLLVVEKPEKKSGSSKGSGKKKISGKVEELSLANILAELEAAIDREKDLDTLSDAIEAMDLTLSMLKVRVAGEVKAKKAGKLATATTATKKAKK